jgi:hypothetical protein
MRLALAALVGAARTLALARALALTSAAPLVAQAPAPDLNVITADPVVLIDNYDEAFPSNCAGYSLASGCFQTLVGIYYPTGSGPGALGYSNPKRPVLVQLRGGNSNNQSPTQLGWFQTYALPHGFVGVDPNYAPVLPGQDFTVSLDDVAYLVQYLRHYHEWLNIDPDRIFVFGRSFGGVMSFAVGLRHDYQNLASSNPIQHQSSRPNFIIPFSAMADMNCLAPQVLWGELLQLFFPVSTAPGATSAQKDADSPAWWLTHPEVFNRPWTPRICLGYAPPTGLPCGQYNDPHDGGFAALMLQKIDEFVVKTNQADVGLAKHLVTSAGDQYAFAEAMAEVIDWAGAQLVPQSEGFYLVPPYTPITPAGSLQELRVVGATPGAIVGFFAGFATGAVVVPGCANIQTGLLDFFPLGWRFADAAGTAALSVYAPPQAIGLNIVVHAADFANCEVSQLMHKTWSE